MSKTLVTGATGLIGFNIVQALLAEERKVKALVRDVVKARQALPPEVEIFQGDITDRQRVQSAITDCDVVYHAACLPDQWLPDPNLFQEVNVQGTQNVVEAALQGDIRKLIYMSTVDVFEAAPGEHYDESRLQTPPKGTPCQRSRQEADRRVVEALQQDLDAVFVHPAAVYGPAPAAFPGLNNLIVNLARNKVPMVPPGTIPVVFAPDLAIGCLAAEERASTGQRYILSESCLDFPEVARIIAEELGLASRAKAMPLWFARAFAAVGEWLSDRTGKPPLLHTGQLHLLQWRAVPVSAKAQRELNWQPTSFREGIKQTIEYLFPGRHKHAGGEGTS